MTQKHFILTGSKNRTLLPITNEEARMNKIIKNELEEFFNSMIDEFSGVDDGESVVIDEFQVMAGLRPFFDSYISRFDDKSDEFEILSRSLIKYLNNNHHPHTHILITSDTAEVSEGIKVIQVD